MFKKVLPIGLTLFALFFGAGNLIFPIKLGWDSGNLFPQAILGFLVTGVGFPLLGIIANSTCPEGILGILREKVGRVFSLTLLTSIYLTIGPLFAIPRTATTSYTIGVVPNLGQDSPVYLLVFSALYLLLVLALSLKPNRIVDMVGKILTPTLLLVIALLALLAFLHLNQPVLEVKGPYLKNSAFAEGFSAGYLTMDAIGSITFSMISLTAINAIGIQEKGAILKASTFAALVAGISLTLVYLSLGWIGNHYQLSSHQLQWLQQNQVHEGAYILTASANSLLSSWGPVAVSVIVGLACLTTAVGLTVAISDFFFQLLRPYVPKLKYSFCVGFISLISFILANQGLNQVIKASIPILNILYPVTILIIFLVLLDQGLFDVPRLAFRLAIGVTALISVACTLFPNHMQLYFSRIYQLLGLPIQSIIFVWIPPAIVAFSVGYLLHFFLKQR
ncbi:MAG: branched-chain amino acid transport system II carrier protein [Neisseriaceae bacterium]